MTGTISEIKRKIKPGCFYSHRQEGRFEVPWEAASGTATWWVLPAWNRRCIMKDDYRLMPSQTDFSIGREPKNAARSRHFLDFATLQEASIVWQLCKQIACFELDKRAVFVAEFAEVHNAVLINMFSSRSNFFVASSLSIRQTIYWK